LSFAVAFVAQVFLLICNCTATLITHMFDVQAKFYANSENLRPGMKLMPGGTMTSSNGQYILRIQVKYTPIYLPTCEKQHHVCCLAAHRLMETWSLKIDMGEGCGTLTLGATHLVT
jgi:hypothetical protein